MYPNISANFTQGTFTTYLVYNNTGYVSPNGSKYTGFDVVFNVTNQTQSQLVIFQWAAGKSTGLPSLATASLYGGSVKMTWSTSSSAYSYVTGPAVFLDVLVKTP